MKFSAKITARLLAVACVVIFSCQDDDTDALTRITVQHFLQPINNPILKQGYWIETKTDPEVWQLHVAPIEGLDFEWGYTYDLLVTETGQREGNEDMPGPAWKVAFVVNKTKAPADAVFGLYLSTSEKIGTVSVDESLNFTMSNGMTINCGSLCEAFAERLAAQNEINDNIPITAFFKHVNNTTLELVSWEAVGSRVQPR